MTAETQRQQKLKKDNNKLEEFCSEKTDPFRDDCTFSNENVVTLCKTEDGINLERENEFSLCVKKENEVYDKEIDRYELYVCKDIKKDARNEIEDSEEGILMRQYFYLEEDCLNITLNATADEFDSVACTTNASYTGTTTTNNSKTISTHNPDNHNILKPVITSTNEPKELTLKQSKIASKCLNSKSSKVAIIPTPSASTNNHSTNIVLDITVTLNSDKSDFASKKTLNPLKTSQSSETPVDTPNSLKHIEAERSSCHTSKNKISIEAEEHVSSQQTKVLRNRSIIIKPNPKNKPKDSKLKQSKTASKCMNSKLSKVAIVPKPSASTNKQSRNIVPDTTKALNTDKSDIASKEILIPLKTSHANETPNSLKHIEATRSSYHTTNSKRKLEDISSASTTTRASIDPQPNKILPKRSTNTKHNQTNDASVYLRSILKPVKNMSKCETKQNIGGSTLTSNLNPSLSSITPSSSNLQVPPAKYQSKSVRLGTSIDQSQNKLKTELLNVVKTQKLNKIKSIQTRNKLKSDQSNSSVHSRKQLEDVLLEEPSGQPAKKQKLKKYQSAVSSTFASNKQDSSEGTVTANCLSNNFNSSHSNIASLSTASPLDVVQSNFLLANSGTAATSNYVLTSTRPATLNQAATSSHTETSRTTGSTNYAGTSICVITSTHPTNLNQAVTSTHPANLNQVVASTHPAVLKQDIATVPLNYVSTSNYIETNSNQIATRSPPAVLNQTSISTHTPTATSNTTATTSNATGSSNHVATSKYVNTSSRPANLNQIATITHPAVLNQTSISTQATTTTTSNTTATTSNAAGSSNHVATSKYVNASSLPANFNQIATITHSAVSNRTSVSTHATTTTSNTTTSTSNATGSANYVATSNYVNTSTRPTNLNQTNYTSRPRPSILKPAKNITKCKTKQNIGGCSLRTNATALLLSNLKIPQQSVQFNVKTSKHPANLNLTSTYPAMLNHTSYTTRTSATTATSNYPTSNYVKTSAHPAILNQITTSTHPTTFNHVSTSVYSDTSNTTATSKYVKISTRFANLKQTRASTHPTIPSQDSTSIHTAPSSSTTSSYSTTSNYVKTSTHSAKLSKTIALTHPAWFNQTSTDTETSNATQRSKHITPTHPAKLNQTIPSTHPACFNQALTSTHTETSNATQLSKHKTSNYVITSTHPAKPNQTIASTHAAWFNQASTSTETSNATQPSKHKTTSNYVITSTHPANLNKNIASKHPTWFNEASTSTHTETPDATQPSKPKTTSEYILTSLHPAKLNQTIASTHPTWFNKASTSIHTETSKATQLSKHKTALKYVIPLTHPAKLNKTMTSTYPAWINQFSTSTHTETSNATQFSKHKSTSNYVITSPHPANLKQPIASTHPVWFRQASTSTDNEISNAVQPSKHITASNHIITSTHPAKLNQTSVNPIASLPNTSYSTNIPVPHQLMNQANIILQQNTYYAVQPAVTQFCVGPLVNPQTQLVQTNIPSGKSKRKNAISPRSHSLVNKPNGQSLISPNNVEVNPPIPTDQLNIDGILDTSNQSNFSSSHGSQTLFTPEPNANLTTTITSSSEPLTSEPIVQGQINNTAKKGRPSKVYKTQTVKCNICGKLLSSPAHLKIHERVHNNQNNYKCVQCNRSFYWLSHLWRHQHLYHSKGNHQCDMCGYSYRHPEELYWHRIKCAEERAKKPVMNT